MHPTLHLQVISFKASHILFIISWGQPKLAQCWHTQQSGNVRKGFRRNNDMMETFYFLSQTQRQKIIKTYPSEFVSPFQEHEARTLREPTGCPPPCKSRSPWLTSQTYPRLPLCGLMFEPWLIHTHANRRRQPCLIQTKMTEVTERKRVNTGTAEEGWWIQTVWCQNVPCASLLWLQPKSFTPLLPDQPNSPPLPRSSVSNINERVLRQNFRCKCSREVM